MDTNLDSKINDFILNSSDRRKSFTVPNIKVNTL